MSTQSAVGMRHASFFGGDFVVVAILYGLGGEDGVQRVGVGLLFHPFPDCVEHVAVDFEGFVAQGGVVKCAEDVVQYFVDGNTRVFPSVEDTAGRLSVISSCFGKAVEAKENLRCHVLQDGSCNSSCNTVELVGEMIFGEHGVCWVGALWVIPRLELRVGAVVLSTARKLCVRTRHTLLRQHQKIPSSKTEKLHQ